MLHIYIYIYDISNLRVNVFAASTDNGKKITVNYLLAGKGINRTESIEEKKYNFLSHQKTAVQKHNIKIREKKKSV